MNTETLADAVLETPDPPCLTCRHLSHCRDTAPEVACADFGTFVDPRMWMGAPMRTLLDSIGRRTPRRWIFKRVFELV